MWNLWQQWSFVGGNCTCWCKKSKRFKFQPYLIQQQFVHCLCKPPSGQILWQNIAWHKQLVLYRITEYVQTLALLPSVFISDLLEIWLLKKTFVIYINFDGDCPVSNSDPSSHHHLLHHRVVILIVVIIIIITIITISSSIISIIISTIIIKNNNTVTSLTLISR